MPARNVFQNVYYAFGIGAVVNTALVSSILWLVGAFDSSEAKAKEYADKRIAERLAPVDDLRGELRSLRTSVNNLTAAMARMEGRLEGQGK